MVDSINEMLMFLVNFFNVIFSVGDLSLFLQLCHNSLVKSLLGHFLVLVLVILVENVFCLCL